MKRILLSFAMMISLSFLASAQNFDGKNIDIAAGIGLGSPYTYGTSLIPPIWAQADFGVADKISVGGMLGFTTSKYGFTSYNWRYTYTLIGARGNYHWGKHLSSLPDKLDLYAGVNLGYYLVKVNYDGYTGVIADGVSNSVFFGGQVGGRWFFKDNLAAIAELGYGIAYLRVGLNFRLK